MPLIFPSDIKESGVEADRGGDWVALSNQFNRYGSACHGALLINYEGSIAVFHYTGTNLLHEDLSSFGQSFHKVSDTVAEDDVPAFLAMCRKVLEKDDPTYGFFTGASFYDYNGNFHDTAGSGYRMTCVGFCLAVLQGFLERDYLEYTTWPTVTSDPFNRTEEDYLEWYCAQHNLDINTITSLPKRIAPLEYLISGFYIDLPISKSTLDAQKSSIQSYMYTKLGISEEE